MDSNKQAVHLTKLDLDNEAVVENALTVLTNFLPVSLRIVAAIKMYKVFKVPGFEVYQPKAADSCRDNIWFVKQAGDLSMAENTLGIFCQDSAAELEIVSYILEEVLDWHKHQAIFATPAYICKHLRSLFDKKGSKSALYRPHKEMVLDKLEDLPAVPKLFPGNVQVKTLTLEHVKTMADNWNGTKVEGSKIAMDNIEHAVINNLACGVFEEDTLAAYLVIHKKGCLSLLTTLPEYRHKGYAQLCIGTLSRTYFELTNLPPFVYISEDNNASISLFSKMGFRVTQESAFLFYSPEEQ